mmetsp:Transcript_24244/g.22044  ORF Transcript_24244/g.22044 Transcript_24244/m.22044 type:complete len:234 (-) Transcript_24244:6-707(-)
MQNTSSLVKYNTPIMVSVSNTQKKKQLNNSKNEKLVTHTDDILNSILPPREWTENGQLWVQYVSSTPATRLDVVNLQEKLDSQLIARQARETGICPIRSELYSQCFDELIRQITINCDERGLLLLRVRDEARMTQAAYETLYESAIAYGIRKTLIAEHKKIELDNKIKSLSLVNKDLLNQVENLKKTIETTTAKAMERRELEEKTHTEEVERIHRTNDQLKTSLETLLSAPKK